MPVHDRHGQTPERRSLPTLKQSLARRRVEFRGGEETDAAIDLLVPDLGPGRAVLLPRDRVMSETPDVEQRPGIAIRWDVTQHARLLHLSQQLLVLSAISLPRDPRERLRCVGRVSFRVRGQQTGVEDERMRGGDMERHRQLEQVLVIA